MANLPEARKRSVDNLQRLYTVVVSLAVTESLRRLLSSYIINPTNTNPTTPVINSYKEWFMFISLVITLIPFYHGANRYLDATYVTEERKAKHYALLVDFIMLFLEGLLFFGLAIFTTNEDVFYSILALLLVLDIIWVGLTNLSATSENDKFQNYPTWAVINAFAAAALFLFTWSNAFKVPIWPNGFPKNLALMLTAIVRTVIDYKLVWKFYYPADALKSDNIPAPPPAPTPSPK